MIETLKTIHKKQFSKRPSDFYFAPGRVNLIGEHTDYAGGHVMPIALPIGIYAAVSKRTDQKIRVYSLDAQDVKIEEFMLDNCEYQRDDSYIKYIKGMFCKILLDGYRVSEGLDITLKSDMPIAAGLSSSAALMMLTALIVADQNKLNIERRWMVRYAKFVENTYLGLRSGIMDQYIIAFAREDHALFLDTLKVKHEDIPFKLENHALLILNTNKPRNLTDSEYNDRVVTVEEATKHFKRLRGIETLCELDIKGFNQFRNTINNPIMLQRIEHILYENARTIAAANALKANDFKQFGEFMNQSHDSLRYLYQVSTEELDYLVEETLALGALGARMSGAGFGGSIIALFEKSKLPETFDALKESYQNRFKRTLDIYPVTASKSAHKLT